MNELDVIITKLDNFSDSLYDYLQLDISILSKEYLLSIIDFIDGQVNYLKTLRDGFTEVLLNEKK